MDYRLIGRKIRECRKQKDMSQAELAEQVELSIAHIGYIENAERHPSLTALFNISIALDTTVDYLLTGYHKNSLQCGSELTLLLGDCSAYEQYILLKTLAALKSALRDKSLPFVSDDLFG